MKRIWILYTESFETRSLRERALVIVTVVAIIVALGYVGMIESSMTRFKLARGRLAAQQMELADIQQRLLTTQTSVNDQDIAARARLEKAKKQISEVNNQLRTIQEALVPPDRVTSFLEEILGKSRGVELVSLRNLPVTDVIDGKAPVTGERTDASTAQAVQLLKRERALPGKELAPPDIDSIKGPLFKHGVEVTVSGSYSDLMAYVSALERKPQKMLWSS